MNKSLRNLKSMLNCWKYAIRLGIQLPCISIGLVNPDVLSTLLYPKWRSLANLLKETHPEITKPKATCIISSRVSKYFYGLSRMVPKVTRSKSIISRIIVNFEVNFEVYFELNFEISHILHMVSGSYKGRPPPKAWSHGCIF